MPTDPKPASRPSPAPKPVDVASRTKDLLQTAPQVSLPKGGGAHRGMGETVKANPTTGTAGISVPLPLSPGRGGGAPQLALSYDSGAGNGPFGLGWNLGVPVIQRRTDRGIPRYRDGEESDTFVLSEAEELVPLLDLVGETWTRHTHETLGDDDVTYTVFAYRPRTEGAWTRIERWVHPETGRSHWVTISRDNVRRIYGRSDDAVLADPDQPGHIFAWYLEREQSESGERVSYVYVPEDRVGAPKTAAEAVREQAGHQCANLYLKRILYANLTPFSDAGGYAFEAVFDYGEHTTDPPTRDLDQDWPARQDIYSRYRSGFDIRCYRLCRRVLVFHRYPSGADEDAVLARALELTYSEDPAATTLTSAQVRGYRTDGETTETATLPPLSFTYTAASVEPIVSALDGMVDLPGGYDAQQQLWVDLDGEGLTGLLVESGQSWWYKRNEGAGRLGALRQVHERPAVNLGDAQVRLMDLDGDGRLEIVSTRPGLVGSWSRDPDEGWVDQHALRQVPNLDWNSPDARWIDLDGDGLADLLVTGERVYTYYPLRRDEGTGPAGFDGPEHARPPREGEAVVLFSGRDEGLMLADMTGDGLADLVQVHRGAVSYWPNRGYGRFGAQIKMRNAPALDSIADFDPRRVRFVDLDGTGTADLVYIGRDGVKSWSNRCGNSFGEAVTLSRVPGVEDPTAVQFTDLLGEGTLCLVWSSGQARDRHAPVRYARLFAAGKPYLMATVDNHFGKLTTLTYTPSTAFYLDARAAGTPWVTPLPFPVMCLSKVETHDRITGHRFVSTTTYGHGYFDGVEREFRGFGYVEQRDAESIADFAADAEDADALAFYQPPVVTKSWFHTGAFPEREALEQKYASEFYTYSGEDYRLDPSTLPSGLSPTDQRAAWRALRGAALRVEVYAEDGTADADKPYTITATRMQVVQVQPSQDKRAAVFQVLPAETVAWHLERDPEDPRVAQELTLQVDEYGTVIRKASVAYPRSGVSTGPQGQRVVLVTEAKVKHDVPEVTLPEEEPPEAELRRHIAVPWRSQSWSLTGLEASVTQRYTIEELNTAFEGADDIPWEATPTGGSTSERQLLSDQVTTYCDETASPMTERAPGEIGAVLLVYQRYQLAMTATQVTEVYDTDVDGTALAAAGYTHGPVTAHTGWWVRSGVSTVDPDHFYLPTLFTDPFGAATSVVYDDAWIFPVSATDPVGNTVAAEIDPQALQPTLVTDPNGNRQAAAFDPLGRVVKTAVMGKIGDSDGDTLEDPSVEITYALDAWDEDGQPAHAHIRSRETHADEESRWMERYVYQDGLGNVVQEKVSAEPGLAPERDENGDLVFVSDELQYAEADPRWVGTGRVIVDNKNNPVRRYEPFFSATHNYEFESQLVEMGVSATTTFDPLGRAVRVDLPDGTFRKVTFTPWEQISYDENDTVLDSDWYAAHDEERVGELSAEHADTPTAVHLDVQGRVYTTDEKLDESTTYTTTLTLDVMGNPRVVTDAREIDTQTQTFDMLGRPLITVSPDAGTDRVFYDVAGQPVVTWRSGDLRLRFAYDELRRRTRMWVQEGVEDERLVERTLYGEASTDPEDTNHKGRLYRQYDTAGVLTSDSYDFKGNLLSSTRRFWADVDEAIDWSPLEEATDPEDPDDIEAEEGTLLEAEEFTVSQTYDALNRVLTRTTPDDSVTQIGYNEAGFLETLSADLQGVTATDFITAASYNARGQRETVEYANGVTASYTYDTATYRLARLLTTRPGGEDPDKLQDLTYIHDPVGNIVSITDAAHDTLYFNNMEIKPENLFEYDALYRLVYAKGREKLEYGSTSHSDPAYGGIPAGTGPITQVYEETYTYDAVGNFLELDHAVPADTGESWSRSYDIATDSNRLQSTTVGSNTFTYTTDDRGSITGMPHLSGLTRDFRDQIARVGFLGGSDNAVYLYDAGGQRVRKVVRRGANTETRSYIGGGAYEVYRKAVSGTQTVERQTLHLMDGGRRVAVVDTLTAHPTATVPQTVQRYQLDNHLGTATVEVNEDAEIISYEEYHPYGTTAWHASDGDVEVSLKRYRYTGMEKDEETGFAYHGARYYLPWLGRWSSADPIGLGDGVNRYGYVHGNPAGGRDSTGMGEETGSDEYTEQSFSYGNYGVSIAADSSILVEKGDWLSKYSAAIYSGDTTHTSEFKRMVDGNLVDITDPDEISVGERIYFAPALGGTGTGEESQQPWTIAGVEEILGQSAQGREALEAIASGKTLVFRADVVPDEITVSNGVTTEATGDDSGSFGFTKPGMTQLERTITVDTDLSDEDAAATLIHEFLHSRDGFDTSSLERYQETEASHRVVVSQWRLDNNVATNDTRLPAPDTDYENQLAKIKANPAYGPIGLGGYKVLRPPTVVPGTVSSLPAYQWRRSTP